MDTQRGKLTLKYMIDTSAKDLQLWSSDKLNKLAMAYKVSSEPKSVAKAIIEPFWFEIISMEAHMFSKNLDIHAIWIGSYISDKYLENIKTWFSLLKPNTVTLWYDSNHPLATQKDEPLGDRLPGELQVKDIRSIDIFNPDKYTDERIKNILPKLEEIYKIESGITPRKIGKVQTTEFINFGLTTDILRLLLLYLYPGLYLDVDITKNYSINQDPVPCKIGMCFAWHQKGSGPADPEGYDNSVIYYDEKGTELLIKYLERIVNNYNAQSGIKNQQCQYLLIPDVWVRLTGQTTGPGGAPDELKFNYEELDILYKAKDDPKSYLKKEIEKIYESLTPSKEDVRKLKEAKFYEILDEDEPTEDEYGYEDEDEVSEILRYLNIIKSNNYQDLLKDIAKKIVKEEKKFIQPKYFFRTLPNEQSTWQTSKTKRKTLFEQLKNDNWSGCKDLQSSTIRYIENTLKNKNS